MCLNGQHVTDFDVNKSRLLNRLIVKAWTWPCWVNQICCNFSAYWKENWKPVMFTLLVCRFVGLLSGYSKCVWKPLSDFRFEYDWKELILVTIGFGSKLIIHLLTLCRLGVKALLMSSSKVRFAMQVCLLWSSRYRYVYCLISYISKPMLQCLCISFLVLLFFCLYSTLFTYLSKRLTWKSCNIDEFLLITRHSFTKIATPNNGISITTFPIRLWR